jgi:hypothetical protein
MLPIETLRRFLAVINVPSPQSIGVIHLGMLHRTLMTMGFWSCSTADYQGNGKANLESESGIKKKSEHQQIFDKSLEMEM